MHFYKKPTDRKRYENLKIPYKIEPFEDESLTSYLVRVAQAFHCSPTSFYYLYFPEYFKDKVLFRRDMDIWADEDFIRKLSNKTRVSFEKLWHTTLRSYEGYLFERCRVNTTTFMIDTLGLRGNSCNGYGYKICPECFRESKTPYMKKIWRVSFYTVCLSHKNLLLDRCPKCHASITPFKPSSNGTLFACYRCSFDFKESKTIKITEDSLGFKAVERLTEVLENGYFSWSDGNYTYSITFFIVVRQLVNLMRILLKKGMISEKEVFKNEVLCQTELYQKVTDSLLKKREIENIGVIEKYFLFSTVVRLLENYPHRLLEFLDRHQVRYSMLVRDFSNDKDVPYFYYSIIRKYKNSYPEAMSSEEFKSVLELLKKKDYAPTLSNLEKVFGIRYKPKCKTENHRIYKEIRFATSGSI